MTIAAIRESVIRAGIDATPYERGAQQIARANDAIARSGGEVAATQERVARTVQSGGGAIERLQRNLDQAYAAQRRFEQAQNLINASAERGRISAQRQAELLELARQRYLGAASGANALAAANDNMARSSGRMGSIIQQAGFQIGDFAVQVASGGSALTALVQQGSQLLGLFGPAGAIAGAALAIGAVAVRLFQARDASVDAATATDSYREAMERLGVVGETEEEATRRRAAERRREVVAIYDQAAATQALVLAQAQEQEQRLLAMREDIRDTNRFLPNFNPDTVLIEPLTRVRGAAAEAAERLADLQEQLDGALRRLDAQDAANGRVATNTRDAASATDDFNRVLAEGERIRQSVLTDAERLAEEQVRLNDLFQAGAIDLTTYTRALTALNDRQAQAAERARERGRRESERAAEQAQREFDRDVERIAEQSSRTFGDVFYGALTGQTRDFGEFLRQTIARAIANAAAEALTRQIVVPVAIQVLGGGPAGATGSAGGGIGGQLVQTAAGQLFQQSGIGSGIMSSANAALFGTGAPTAFYGPMPYSSGILGSGGTASIGGTILGPAAAGFGIGYLGTSVTGSRAAGAGIGVVGGATAGFLMTGGNPIGAIIGGIAGGAGGILGRMGQRGTPYTAGQLYVGPDGNLVAYAAGDNGADASGLQAQLQQQAAGLNALRARTGITFGASSGVFGDRAMTEAEAMGMLFRGVSGGNTEALRAVTGSGRIVDAASFETLIGRAEGFDQLTAALRSVLDVTNDAEQQFRQLSAQLDEAQRFASEFGVSIAGVTREMATDFDEQIRRSILGLTDATALALEDQARTAQARIDLARRIGADIVQVERLNGLERARILEESGQSSAAAFARGLREWLDGQLLGDTSLLTGEQRIAEAQGQFGAALASARAGTGDVGEVTRLADVITGLARELYEGTGQQAFLVNSTRSQVESLGRSLGLPGFASGTDFAPPGYAWVGERGPELVRFRGGEQVVPAGRSAAMAGEGAAGMRELARQVARLVDAVERTGGATVEELGAVKRDLRKVVVARAG